MSFVELLSQLKSEYDEACARCRRLEEENASLQARLSPLGVTPQSRQPSAFADEDESGLHQQPIEQGTAFMRLLCQPSLLGDDRPKAALRYCAMTTAVDELSPPPRLTTKAPRHASMPLQDIRGASTPPMPRHSWSSNASPNNPRQLVQDVPMQDVDDIDGSSEPHVIDTSEPKSLPPSVASSKCKGANAFFDSSSLETPSLLGVKENFRQYLKLWPSWTEPSALDRQDSPGSVGRRPSLVPALLDAPRIRAGDTLRDASFLSKLVARPSSMRRIIWDVASVSLLVYDVIFIPLQAFQIGESAVSRVMDFVTPVFWTVDICWSFLTGFHTGGVVEMRLAKIAARYMRSWFVVDMFLVATDWIVFMLEDSSVSESAGIMRMGKSMRLVAGARILRLVRLVRIFKVMPVIFEFTELIQSEHLLTLLGIVKLLVTISVVNHFIACGWYAVGQINVGDRATSWVIHFERSQLQSPDFSFRYTTALHWSLTLFAPSTMDINPMNVYERVFAICALMLALVMFSSFVSSITSSMTRLRDLNVERSRQQEYVRQYITDNRISLDLANRIYGFLKQHRYMHKRNLQEVDIEIFKILPESLQVNLHYEVYLPTVICHPLFFHLQCLETECIINICHFTTSQICLAVGQELFSRGDNATHMYLVVEGQVDYSSSSDTGSVSITEVPHGFLCEAALWVRWQHQGTLFAVSPTDFVAVNSAAFRSVVRKTSCMAYCVAYAESFQQWLVDLCASSCVLSDTWHDFDAAQEMAQCAGEVGCHAIANGIAPATSFRSFSLVDLPWSAGKRIRAAFGRSSSIER